MRDVFGAIGAFLLDLRWLILGVVFGALLTARCAHAADTPDPAEPYQAFALATGPSGIILFQKGQFSCPAGQHRTILVTPGRAAKLGCALIGDTNTHIDWEIGPSTDIPTDPPGRTDGPATEPPAHPGAIPERNS